MFNNKVRLVMCICVAATLSLLGCREPDQGLGRPSPRTNYQKTVASAVRVLPEAVEMEKIFGQGKVDHFIAHFGMGDERWNSEVYFGGRYILTMQVYIDVDYNKNQISLESEPRFYLGEDYRVDRLGDGRVMSYGRTPEGLVAFGFSRDNWAAFYRSGGDLSVLGVKENKKPVPNFEELVRQVRRDRTPVISLLGEEYKKNDKEVR